MISEEEFGMAIDLESMRKQLPKSMIRKLVDSTGWYVYKPNDPEYRKIYNVQVAEGRNGFWGMGSKFFSIMVVLAPSKEDPRYFNLFARYDADKKMFFNEGRWFETMQMAFMATDVNDSKNYSAEPIKLNRGQVLWDFSKKGK